MKDRYFKDLLKTKIYIPPLKEGVVPRPRLVMRLLDEGDGKKVILVRAPAGYGKTTLVVEWLSQIGKPHALYSIDQTDNDLARFLTYIIFSLKQIEPDLCDSVLPLIHSQDAHPARIILTRLVNDLSCLSSPTVLVIDDYHLIRSDTIHEAMAFILQNLPSHLQIAFISRHELPFSTATLRARDQMLELGVSDLRFTAQETDAFARDLLKVDLSAEELRELDEKTDGWVTSLQLTLIGLKWKDNADLLQKLSGRDRLIAGYLLDEVFESQPAKIQDFLLRTSLLSRFCAPLCEALLDDRSSQGTLERLEENNAFVIPLDNTRHWYRYHHLFSEFLQKHLQETNREDVPLLYKRASEWHERNGNREEAIEYMLKAGNYEFACTLIQSVLVDTLQKGGRETTIRWMSAIPLETLRKYILLWPYLIFANFDRGTFHEAHDVLDNLWSNETFIEIRPEDERGFVRGFNAAFHAAIAIHTRLDAPLTKQLTLQALGSFPRDAGYGRSIGFGHYGSACLLMGETAHAIKNLDEAIEESKKEEYKRLWLVWSSYRAEADVEAGRLRKGKAMIEDVLQAAQMRNARETNLVSNAVIGLGRIHYEWNELGKAEHYLREGTLIAEDGEYMDRMLSGYQHYFPYLLHVKDFQTAVQKIEQARRRAALYENPAYVMETISTLEAALDLEMGNLHPELVAKNQIERWSVDELNHQGEFKWHTAAKIGIATGHVKAAIKLLEKLQEIAIQNECGYGHVQLGITLAKAYALDKNPAKAKKVLAVILEIAEPEGYIRSFVDAGEVILEVLQACRADLKQKANPHSRALLAHVKSLLSAFATEGGRTVAAGASSLTEREWDVIWSLEKGLSYAEISSRLFITENTLKTHIKNIYSKLNVRNRTEAVIKAKFLE